MWRAHVFGNLPSLSVAVYRFKRAAVEGEQEYGSDARLFIEQHFYVDDGLKSFSSESEATGVLHRAQQMLAQSNLFVHKISSNSPVVTRAFPNEDLATTLQGLDKLTSHLTKLRIGLGLVNRCFSSINQ